MKICIDAGHGETDSGGVGIGGRLEKNDTLRFSNALATKCKAAGINVVQTRTGDSYPSLNDRCDLANAAGCNYFVSIHRNAYWLSSANGLECLAYKTDSFNLAKAIQKRIVAVGGKDRCGDLGYKKQSATVLRNTNMPATTVELGFITNVADNLLFDLKFDEYVQAVFDGIVDASGFVPYKDAYEYTAIRDTVLILSAKGIKAGEKIHLLSYSKPSIGSASFGEDEGLIVFADFKK